jgi:REP element-mobilizing transposase RayT
MPQSFACHHYHLIFSTKHREPRLTPEIQPRLYEYFGGILRARNSKLIAAGGIADHVHLLVSLSKQLAISDVLRDLKANSSGWIHDTFADQKSFAWQIGSGAFAVSYSAIEDVRRYIAHQAEHHRVKSFQEEFVEFLRRHQLEFDDRYLWE